MTETQEIQAHTDECVRLVVRRLQEMPAREAEVFVGAMKSSINRLQMPVFTDKNLHHVAVAIFRIGLSTVVLGTGPKAPAAKAGFSEAFHKLQDDVLSEVVAELKAMPTGEAQRFVMDAIVAITQDKAPGFTGKKASLFRQLALRGFGEAASECAKAG